MQILSEIHCICRLLIETVTGFRFHANMSRNMPIKWIFFINKFQEKENYIFWFLYPCVFHPNATVPASASWSPTALVPPWHVFPSPCSLIHCSYYPQVLVWCTNSSSHLYFQWKLSYFFSLNGYIFSLLTEMPFFAYNLHGWKHHVGILGWILSCWDERWKVVYWSHVSPMKTFPSDQSSSVWAIYAVLIPRRKNYCLTATPHPLLASKVELGFS